MALGFAHLLRAQQARRGRRCVHVIERRKLLRGPRQQGVDLRRRVRGAASGGGAAPQNGLQHLLALRCCRLVVEHARLQLGNRAHQVLKATANSIRNCCTAYGGFAAAQEAEARRPRPIRHQGCLQRTNVVVDAVSTTQPAAGARANSRENSPILQLGPVMRNRLPDVRDVSWSGSELKLKVT